MALTTLTARAEIASWLQWLPVTSPALGILYRAFPTISGSTPVRRPPRDTAPELARAGDAAPADTDLIAIAAREYEAQLDFTNAEAQWKRFEAASSDRAAGLIALADYYHRRMQPQPELEAITAAASTLPAVDDPLKPEEQQRAWKLHERAQQLVRAEAMPSGLAVRDFESWVAQYPQAQAVYRRYFDFLVANGTPDATAQLLERYQRAFASDRVFPVLARASIAESRGAPADAIAAYDAAFDPLWPQELIDAYFKLLTDAHRSFDFYQDARRNAVARPQDLAPAARLFHFYLKQGDPAAARRELAEFRVRKESAQQAWTATELRTLAQLSALAEDHEEVVRYAYALYSLPGADAESVETALVRIIDTLLKAPDQPLRFGRGDLSFYKDIAALDPSPGFLNGILSLLFNSQYPDAEFSTQERRSEAYFHRAKAAELYKLLIERFPNSTRRSELLSRLIETYAMYGEDDAIVSQGVSFINEFPDAEQRPTVALQVADAYARRQRVPDELAMYDRLLGEVAAKNRQVPLGGAERPRSPEYARILERYISRLTQLKRIPDALALYRREIDRNPDDPGLYDRLADFLGANQRAAEVEQVYRRAVQRFQDPSWSHKLARFYLRSRLSTELQTLSRQVVDTFSGADVESYITDVVADGAFERRLQLDINLYARRRFPHDLRFVHNLISLYSSGVTADAAALQRLLAEHWYEDESIRRMYFERLAASGSLAGAVQNAVNLLPAETRGQWAEAERANPAVTRFIAEAEAWQSHFEQAAAPMRAVAEAYPADAVLAGRASDLYRSLAGYDAANTSVAVAIAEQLSRSEPRNRERLIRAGEIYADREQMAPAVAIWNRLGSIEPGTPESYLEAATLFWDYLRPADAASWLRRGRTQLKNPTLWSYEMGAIHEAERRPLDAVSEYLNGALSGSSAPSQARLLRLAPRQDYRKLIDDETRRKLDASPADPRALEVRISVLRAQQREPELEPLLERTVRRTSSREILSYVGGVADETSNRDVQESVIRRRIQLESDPQDRLRLRIQLAHFLEAGGELPGAKKEIDSVYKDSPLISGVIRAAADFYWRHDKPRAIRVLATAAERAHASVKPSYLVETARKAIDAAVLKDAMEAADALLRLDPLNGQYIALKADALEASRKEPEIQQLYAAKIQEIQQSQLSQADKTERIAAMRRGLVPVLARQMKYREALDQYIEIVNRFPDDQTVLAEAARFASQHDLKTPLIAFYAGTVARSPRDHRWAIVLARIQTQFEDYPAAIEAYRQAMVARPERQDLAIARADLEERTFRFADAITSYNRVYELSRNDPAWLERIARLQARLGQNREAVATLQRAYIDNRPASAREYARVAGVLEEIGLLNDAAAFIQQQAASGTDGPAGWQESYIRIMTRTRRAAEALPMAITSSDSRLSRAMGQAVNTYFTPEERQSFETLLLTRGRPGSPEAAQLIVLANAAGLYDVEARLRVQEASRNPAARAEFVYGSGDFIFQQERRMKFSELAQQFEAVAATATGADAADERRTLYSRALDAYREVGDTAGELALLARQSELQINYRQRYYELLAASNPDQLLRIASAQASDSSSLLATQALIAAGDSTRALQAIRAPNNRNPVWKDAYTGLVGAYFGLDSPDVQSAFERALGPQVIQDRIGKPADRTRVLAGDIWFYYGQRYGEYLRDAGRAEASEDYIAAQFESRPGDPAVYVELARYYQQRREPDRALNEFRHGLELNANQPGVHSSVALVLMDLGRQSEAVVEWRTALTQLQQEPGSPAAAGVVRDIRARQQATALRPELDSAMRAAAGRLQVWQITPLLQALFEGTADSQWLLDLARVSRYRGEVLAGLSDQAWLSSEQRGVILPAAMAEYAAAPARRFDYQRLRQRYLDYLIENNDPAAAGRLFASYTEAERMQPEGQDAEIRVAASEGRLPALLGRYRQNPSQTPPDWVLQNAAVWLAARNRTDANRLLLEFLYTKQIEQAPVNAAAFLGLAEIRLKQGRPGEAVELLKRLNLLSPVPFEHLTAAARLLTRENRAADAGEFLKMRLQAVPWDDEVRLELATIEKDAANLQRVMTSSSAPYDIRTRAAREFSRSGTRATTTGVRELDLLSGAATLTAAAAEAPHFFAARLAAAEQATAAEARLRLLLGAIAVQPGNREQSEEIGAVRRQLFSAAMETRQYALALAAYRRTAVNDPEVAAGMAEAHLQLGRPGEASRFFATAANQEKDEARRQTYRQREQEARAAAQRSVENERRRPVMRAELEQPNVVQRRLP